MLTLAILRHAKSDWNAPVGDDFDRPLNLRGRTAAPHAGETIAALGLKPTLILCSSSKRTRETLDLALPKMQLAPHTEIVTADKLYLANFVTLLDVLRGARDTHRCVLMIAHNPGLHEFAIALAGAGEPGTLSALHRRFPTAGLATMDIKQTHWRDVARDDGVLTHYWTPKNGMEGGAELPG